MIELTPEKYQAIDAPLTQAAPTQPAVFDIPAGVRRSKAALRRDLPELLAKRGFRGKYICYHLEERVGIDKDYFDLIRECNRRNIPDGEFIIQRIAPNAGSEEEEEIDSNFV